MPAEGRSLGLASTPRNTDDLSIPLCRGAKRETLGARCCGGLCASLAFR
jgi:hypothetical protein